MKKIILICMSVALSTLVMANNKEQPNKCPNAQKNNLTELVIAHITEHGILTEQELADFTAIFRQLSHDKRKLNKENRAIKKQLESCTDSKQMVDLMQQIATNDLKRAQLDKEALDAYIEKIDASRLVQVLQCSEKYKNNLFKEMRIKRQEMKEKTNN
ncbi:MAG: hypothetical protein IIX52_06340 [Paludibacteraceae bacterium]|nr:hypothetical protein [Paludibacteraceae bacterium]